jgi:SAM-dependent methyltransferase
VNRHEGPFIRKIESYCRGNDVLEIGCGDGKRSIEVAGPSKSWIGIDLDRDSIQQAAKNVVLENVEFIEGRAEALQWSDATFDVVMFTLSLHHIDLDIMPVAIDEAIRVLRPGGVIIFLEPMPVGTFFNAEMLFGCCDGDERRELAYANFTMLNSERLIEIEEFIDQVSVEYDSFEDFTTHVPTQEGTHAELERFLSDLQLTLNEKFRMNVFQVCS